MLHYIMIALKVLFVELAGVTAFTGILYVYWNILTKKEKKTNP